MVTKQFHDEAFKIRHTKRFAAEDTVADFDDKRVRAAMAPLLVRMLLNGWITDKEKVFLDCLAPENCLTFMVKDRTYIQAEGLDLYPFEEVQTTATQTGEDIFSHRYRPAVGATAGLGFYWSNHRGEPWDAYARKYCMDDAFERAIRRATGAATDGPGLFENRIDYLLTSGGNWANGTIGTFHLTVDKGSPDNLVSFCGPGVRKTGPTTFEMTVKDFYPTEDIHILLLQRIPR